MQAPLTDDDLVYAATARCPCGAGLAYVPGGRHPTGVPIHGYWECGDVLLGRAKPDGTHQRYPFVFYEIKGERQPSARGATTRPGGIAKDVYD